ncbi:MAG: HAMP domain-containing histidine kinase [Bacteroidales bacterium]|nr:HAMP domain-containing histidine kinase [Bacteroidales bacterium]
MDKKRFSILVAISAIALSGIMIIQLYGIRNAAMFQREQFAGSVQIGLKTVANRLLEMQVDTNVLLLQSCKYTQDFERQRILPLLISPAVEKLIDDEFQVLKIGLAYDYGVYRTPDDIIEKTSNVKSNRNLLDSPHFVSFSCIYDHEGYNLAVWFPNQKSLILQSILPWASLLFILIVVLVVSFYKIIRMFLIEKKLSDMKTDFVNNMTHEFKTPIASLSLAADMLLRSEVNSMPCQVQKYAKIISDENNRLKSRVEQVLHLTLVERGEFQLKMKQVDVHKVIDEGLKPYKLLIKQQKGNVTKRFTAQNTLLVADHDHLENVVSNLVDNAIKYSIGSPEITIETRNNDGGVYIAVEDRGIGISSEHQQDIFRRFYRVSTGNLHDAKGFGLGLFYVNTVVKAHHGNITVKSQPGKGSRFEVYIPSNGQATD